MVHPWPASDLLGTAANLSRGAVIAKAGSVVRTLHLIEQGLVGKFLPPGGRDVLDAIRWPGWVIGAESAMTTGCYQAVVKALTDCVLRPIDIEAFRKATQRPEVSAWLNTMFAAAAVGQEARNARLAAGGAAALVIDIITAFMLAAGRSAPDGSIRLAVPLQVTELADLIGATREHTSRVVTDLEGAGDLTRLNGWFIAPPGSQMAKDIRSRRPSL